MIAPYDIVMLAVLAVAVLFGIWKGMVWQLASLCSVALSTLVAIHSSQAIAPWFGKQEPWNRFAAMAALYVVTAFAVWIVFRLISNVIDRVQLKEFDRQLGATFGLLKGALYCVVITFFAVTLSETGRQGVLQSRSGDLIARGIRYADPILPEDIRTYLGKYIAEFDAKLHAPPATAGQTGDTPGMTAPATQTPADATSHPLPTLPANSRGGTAKPSR